jgi:hypothetical protein
VHRRNKKEKVSNQTEDSGIVKHVIIWARPKIAHLCLVKNPGKVSIWRIDPLIGMAGQTILHIDESVFSNVIPWNTSVC